MAPDLSPLLTITTDYWSAKLKLSEEIRLEDVRQFTQSHAANKARN